MAILRTLTRRFTGPWRALLQDPPSTTADVEVAAQWRQVLDLALDETRVLSLEGQEDRDNATRPLSRMDLPTLVAESRKSLPASVLAPAVRTQLHVRAEPLSDHRLFALIAKHPRGVLVLIGVLGALNLLQLLLRLTAARRA